jgi:hypothetical protein
MKYAYPILVALTITFLSLFAPILVLVALPFAKWDEVPSPDSNGQHFEILRGDLPQWASWLSTPDERLPGGTYEPTVWKHFTKYGKWVCAWDWLGLRNRMHGLAYKFAVPLDAPWPCEPDGVKTIGYFEQATNPRIWWWYRRWGPFGVKAGWRQYVIDGRPVGVPCCSIAR